MISLYTQYLFNKVVASTADFRTICHSGSRIECDQSINIVQFIITTIYSTTRLALDKQKIIWLLHQKQPTTLVLSILRCFPETTRESKVVSNRIDQCLLLQLNIYLQSFEHRRLSTLQLSSIILTFCSRQ